MGRKTKEKCGNSQRTLRFLVGTTRVLNTFVVSEDVTCEEIRDFVVKEVSSPDSEMLKVRKVIKDPDQCAETTVQVFYKIVRLSEFFARVFI